MKSLIKENRLNRIIDCAEKVFFEKGFSRASISDICKSANCSRTTLYSHFESKENIYLAVVNKSFQKFIHYFSQLEIKEQNGLDKILRFANGYIDFSKQSPKHYAMMLDFYSILKNINNKKLQSDIDISLSKCSYFKQTKGHAEIPPVFLIHIIEEGQKDGSINAAVSSNILFLNIWAYLIGSSNLFNFSKSQKNITILGVKVEDSDKNTLSVIRKILS